MRIEKRACNRVYDLTHEQEETLKDHLTFDNPAYQNAKRYSKRKYIGIPPYLTYYTTGKDESGRYIECPIGVDIEKVLNYKIDIAKGDMQILGGNFHEAVYPPTDFVLRGQQEEALEAYMNGWLKSNFFKPNPSIISLPTGKGKTILALSIAAKLGAKTLVLVHKDDLVTGWQNDIKDYFGGKVKSGLIKAKSREVGEQITIATVQTLSRMSEEELSKYTDQFGLVIQDECLTGDTLVVQSDGSVERIEKCHTFTSVLGGKVSAPFSRQSEIWELRCNHGVLHGSPTHPTWYVEKKTSGDYSMNDFKYAPLKDIPRNCYIPVITRIPHTEKVSISPKVARFLALILCKGAIENDKVVVRIKGQSDMYSYYADMFRDGCNEFGATFSILQKRSSCDYIACGKTLMFYLANQCGITDNSHLSDGAEIPEFMYRANLDAIKDFIEVCFDCSGDVKVRNRLYGADIESYSEVFANGLSLLLRKFGIVCNVNKRAGRLTKYDYMYIISARGQFFNMFMDIFDILNDHYRNDEERCPEIIVGDYLLSPYKSSCNLGITDTVYDFTVESDSHSFIANGIYTHNCHHVGLNIFNIINKFNSRHKLGLSATPVRSDGLSFVFDLFFGGICYEYKATKDDEDICNVSVEVIDSGFQCRYFLYKGQVFNYYDFKPEELPEDIQFLDMIPYKKRPQVPFLTIDDIAVRSSKTRVKVCKKVLEHYRQGHSCLLLFRQKEHINLYYRYLKLYMPKEKIMLYYGDNKEKFDVLQKKAENREVLVTLATYAKSTEGTNIKAWEVEFLVSSLNDEKNVEQATGRIRRRKEGKIDPVIVYDVRYPECYSLATHYYGARKNVYDALDYSVHDPKEKSKGVFSRGYKR